MPTTFTLHSDTPPTGDMIRAALPDDVEVTGVPEGARPLRAGRARAWRIGVSVGATDLVLSPGQLRITTAQLPSAADLRMARDLVAALSERLDAEVTADEETAVGTDVRVAWGEDWVQRVLAADVGRLLAEMAEGVVRVPGPRRDAHLGPDTLARLGHDGVDQLVTVVRRIQWPEVAIAVRPAATHTLGLDGPTVATWDPSVPTFLPAVDAIELRGHPSVHVPVDALSAVAGDAVHPLDDRQAILDAVPDDLWERVIARARQHELSHPERLDVGHRAGPILGRLLPVLRPSSWDHADEARVRPLFRRPGAPLVSWAWDQGDRVALWPHDARGGRSVQERALANLDDRGIAWQEDRDATGRLRALHAVDEYAAELVLSPAALREAAHRLGVRELWIAIPARGLIRAQRIDDGDADLLEAWCAHVHEEAGEQALWPAPLRIVDGQVEPTKRVRAPRVGPQRASLLVPGFLTATALAVAAVLRLLTAGP